MPKKAKSAKLAGPSKSQLGLFGGEEVVAEAKENALIAMSAAEERMIVAEAQGAEAVQWVYQYAQGNQTVTGISYPGFRRLFRNTYRMLWPDFKEEPTVEVDYQDPRGPTLVAKCRVLIPKAKGKSIPAFAEEPLMKGSKAGGKYPNYHARTVVLGKLLRNAMKMLITDEVAGKFLGACLKTKDRLLSLKEKDAKGGGERVVTTPVKTAKINLIWSIVRGAGLNINDKTTKNKFRGLIVEQFNQRISECGDEQLDIVANWLRENLSKQGADALKSAVEHAYPMEGDD